MSKKAITKKEEGNAHYRKGEHNKAKKCYLEAIQIDPTNIQCYSNLSMVHFASGEYAQSNEVCDQILGMDPNNKKAFYRKALNCNKQNNPIDAISNGKLYLQRQIKQETPNAEGMQAIKTIIKESKQKISASTERTQAVQLGLLKPPALTGLPQDLKQMAVDLVKKDTTTTLDQCKEYLKRVLHELTRNYKSEIHIQIDKIKRLIYRRLVELSSAGEQKLVLLDLLLSTSNLKEEKEELLRKKLSVEGLPVQEKISTMKMLLEITKNSKLEEGIRELQGILKQQYTQQLKSEQLQQESNVQQNGTQKSEVTIPIETIPKPIQQQQTVTQQPLPQQKMTPPPEQISPSFILQKLKRIQKHKSMEQFFELFKKIGEDRNITDEQKIECLKLLSTSSICPLFASGAIKGQKHYIKKLCKELEDDELYNEFKFK